ncbi:MAG: P-II family nitrogen regulator [Candidatus Nitrosocosmicus sp.]|jgi:nitrogen regulatory protein P-II 1|uniref:P-II family nitrogen regulator n=1 Tax=Candidatus Nitrosocosmicus sp. FF01 TaxID=3397670 RepID=UPI0039EA4073
MKEIDIFIDSKDLSKVTDILQKHKAGVTFFDVQGTGRTPKETPENIQSYQTGRTTLARFIGKTHVISIVSDNKVDMIVNEITNSFESKEGPFGVLFVKDVLNAYELGTTLRDDALLITQ